MNKKRAIQDDASQTREKRKKEARVRDRGSMTRRCAKRCVSHMHSLTLPFYPDQKRQSNAEELIRPNPPLNRAGRVGP